jgi:hypothetical protein
VDDLDAAVAVGDGRIEGHRLLRPEIAGPEVDDDADEGGVIADSGPHCRERRRGGRRRRREERRRKEQTTGGQLHGAQARNASSLALKGSARAGDDVADAGDRRNLGVRPVARASQTARPKADGAPGDDELREGSGVELGKRDLRLPRPALVGKQARSTLEHRGRGLGKSGVIPTSARKAAEESAPGRREAHGPSAPRASRTSAFDGRIPAGDAETRRLDDRQRADGSGRSRAGEERR